jgi:hypothetical protein
MRFSVAPLVAAIGLLYAGCAGSGQSAASSTAAGSPGAMDAQQAAQGREAAPEPTATPNFSLLAAENGTILRSFSPAALDTGNNVGNAAEGIGDEPPAGAKPPFVFTFELPGPAKIAAFDAALPIAQPGTTPDSVTFAVSSVGPYSGFADVGTVTADTTDTAKSLTANVTARWVRVTASRLFERVSATGDVAPLPAGVQPSGTYVLERNPYASGGFVAGRIDAAHRAAKFTAVGNGLNVTACTPNRFDDSFTGTTAGRAWMARSPNGRILRGAVNQDASIVAATDSDGSTYYFTRAAGNSKDCNARITGNGPQHVLALEANDVGNLYPLDVSPPLHGYTFTSIGAAMLDSNALAGQDTILFKLACNVADYLNAPQQALLLQWVAGGHKLILTTASQCGSSDFAWLPYPFTASHLAGDGAGGDRLLIIENDALGTADKRDANRFVDATAYAAAAGDRIGETNVAKTQDAHWCGHLFFSGAGGPGGFVQMYAPYQHGLIVYDAFDRDDGALAPYRKIRRLELALAAPFSLPCSQHAASAFVVQPSQEVAFTTGKGATLHLHMEALANLGWRGHIGIKTSGDFPAIVSPRGFDISGGTEPLDIAISIPASAKPGHYAVSVIGDAGNGQTSQSTVALTGTAAAKPK